MKKEERTVKEPACIRCGRCIRVCPLSLMPARLEKAYDRRDMEGGNRRIGKVLADTAKELLDDDNGEKAAQHRHPQGNGGRQVEGQQTP